MFTLDALIGKLRKGDRVIVTDTSRLDRRDNLTSRIETVIDIRRTGAVIVFLDPKELGFGTGVKSAYNVAAPTYRLRCGGPGARNSPISCICPMWA